MVGQDGITYLTKEYSAKTDNTFTATADLAEAPNQMYTVYLELAGLDADLQAANSLFEVTWGNLGESFGEFYSQPYDLQEEVRSLRLSWAGVGVALMVSTDNKLWETVENGKVTLLKNPGRRIWVKGLLKVDPNTVLDGYQLEVNPAKYSLFTGKTLEESTGLMYFGRRWYDPEFGRFITVDPAEDGENWYSYCNNDPTNVTDPDGLYAGGDDLAVFLSGGLINAGIEFGMQVWHGKYDVTRVFTAFLKGGLSAWVGLYTGPGGVAVYAFLDAVEDGVRAKLAGQGWKGSFGIFAQTLVTDMISGVAGAALGKGIAKLAGKLAPKVSVIVSKFKNSKFAKALANEGGYIKPFDIITYGTKASGFEKHHGILNEWCKKLIPGYASNVSKSPTMVLTKKCITLQDQYLVNGSMKDLALVVRLIGTKLAPKKLKSLQKKCLKLQVYQ